MKSEGACELQLSSSADVLQRLSGEQGCLLIVSVRDGWPGVE